MQNNRFTTKAMEALQEAQNLAFESGAQTIEAMHLLATLLRHEDGVVVSVFKKLGVDPSSVRSRAEATLVRGPKEGGGSAQMQVSRTLDLAIRQAHKIAERFKDEYVSTRARCSPKWAWASTPC